MEQLTFETLTDNQLFEDLRKAITPMIEKICKEQEVDTQYIKFENGEKAVKDFETGEIVKIIDPKTNEEKILKEPDPNKLSVWICEPISLKKSDRAFRIEKEDTTTSKGFKVSFIYKRRNVIDVPSDATEVYNHPTLSYIFPHDSVYVYDYLQEIFSHTLKNFEPTEKFGCCGKYVKCSNARKCLHENTFYARCCMYRKNLESGRIFYGKNANT